MMVMTSAPTFSRRQSLALATAGIASSLGMTRAFAAAAKPSVLVELFTSQGCSSCPPADKLAGKLASRSDVVVLSYNVDYWDYLGWRDTLAKPEYSKRQYDYARERGDGNVYTPQMIFNGAAHAVGSQTRSVDAAITAAPPLAIDIELRVKSSEVSIAIPASTEAQEATLWLASVATSKMQEIKRGENAGSSITYHNVVRSMIPATMWKGDAVEGKWMKDVIMTPDSDFCMAILQRGMTGQVLGLARV